MYFLAKLKHEKDQGNGKIKTITDQYLFQGISYGDIESRIAEQGELNTVPQNLTDYTISPFRVNQILPDGGFDKWYKVKLIMYSVDEKSGKDKKVPFMMLINANTVDEAQEMATTEGKTWLIPLEINTIQETKILEVFHHIEKE